MTSGARDAVIKGQFSVLFAYVCVCASFFLWLAILKEVAVDRISI